jgi:hypothetical protein
MNQYDKSKFSRDINARKLKVQRRVEEQKQETLIAVVGILSMVAIVTIGVLLVLFV